MSRYYQNEITRIVSRIPADQREAVVTQALRLITDDVSRFNRSYIINAVSRITQKIKKNSKKHIKKRTLTHGSL